MPRGYPNPKTTPPTTTNQPLILIQRTPDGSIQLSAYGIEHAGLLDVLRRALLHIAAQQDGVQIIDTLITPTTAIRPSVNGVDPKRATARPKPKPAPRRRSYDDDPEDLDELRELMEEV